MVERNETGRQEDILARDDFVQCVHDALRNLYEPDRLRSSPLGQLFHVDRRADPFLALQGVLQQAVAELEPSPAEPPQSSQWDAYETLFYRYVEQLPQKQVAHQLGVSVRHLRRIEYTALDVLAAKLGKQYGVDLAEASEPNTRADRRGTDGKGVSPSARAELAFLLDNSASSSADLSVLVPEVCALLEHVLPPHSHCLGVDVPPDVPWIAAHPVAVREMLLSVMLAASHAMPGAAILLGAQASSSVVAITVDACADATTPLLDDDLARLAVATEIAEMSGGTLLFARGEYDFRAEIRLPVRGRTTVLVIDDNADTLRLLRRYSQGSRYHVIDTRDPAVALSMAGKTRPQIIVLDVMMPQVDGWHLLAQFREHPLTRTVPIVVCTVLPQQDIAIALGASAFLQKPVTQAAFLEALDAQQSALETGSR